MEYNEEITPNMNVTEKDMAKNAAPAHDNGESQSEPLSDEERKNITWDINHRKIIETINKIMEDGSLAPPTVSDIAKATGFTRKTVSRHLKEYKFQPSYRMSKEMFGAIELNIFKRLAHQAMSGNIQAAKLYLELTGKLVSKAGSVQINSVTLDQRLVEKLSREKINKIEEIIFAPSKTEWCENETEE